MKLRRGKIRKHPEGYAVNIFLDDDILYATAYGATPEEATGRADSIITNYNNWIIS